MQLGSVCNQVLREGDELTQASLRNIRWPAGEPKAAFSTGLGSVPPTQSILCHRQSTEKTQLSS